MNTVAQAVESLRNGGVIAYPTETVYGLGCDPDNRAAVMRLLELKERSVSKGLILIAASVDQLYRYIDRETFLQYPHVTDSWPGPNTWLLPCKTSTPSWVCGEYDTLAVRVIDHAFAVKLCTSFNSPIVSTSANLSGRPPARNAGEVIDQFPEGIDFILRGETGGAAVSAIRDARTLERLR